MSPAEIAGGVLVDNKMIMSQQGNLVANEDNSILDSIISINPGARTYREDTLSTQQS